MASLKPGNEVKPKADRLVPPTYRPQGSFAHLVSDGESWQSVADRYQVNAKALIEANFKTTNPYEVNWYLREYVNCKETTADRYNWRFSTAARQGGIAGRAGRVFVVPNWTNLEKVLKDLTKRYVKLWFESTSISTGIINGAHLSVPFNNVRCQMRIDTMFATEFELAGAPTELAQGWAAHLQRGLELFTMNLHAEEPMAFPMYQSWSHPGGVPMMLAQPWPLLRNNDSALAAPGWFNAMVMFPGRSNPSLEGLVNRHRNWFYHSFRSFCLAAMAVQVMGWGMAGGYGGRVIGHANAPVGFLRLQSMLD
ncbi:MAG: hypothetical protein NW208_18505 [Bryobacter sp.]|nr:hypothetical protein [Bryobacter sp.]